MAFKRKTDTTSGEIFKFEDHGQSLTGFFLGSFDYTGEFGPTKKHLFKTPQGIKVVIGQKHLTDNLSDVEAGLLVRVTYESDKKMKKGQPMKVYSVDIDDEQKLDNDELPTADDVAASSSNDDDLDGPAEMDDDIADDDIKTPDAKVPPVKRLDLAESKKRAADVLARLGKKAS